MPARYRQWQDSLLEYSSPRARGEPEETQKLRQDACNSGSPMWASDKPWSSRRTFMKTTGAAVAFGLAGCVGDGGDEEFPSQPIEHIVPYDPGGTYDTYARIIMPELADVLDVNVPIVNMPGAQAMRGVAHAVNADSDGYTFGGIGLPNVAIRALLHHADDDTPYEEMMGLCQISSGEYVIISNPDLEIDGPNDLADRYADGEISQIGGHRGGDQQLAALILQEEGHLPWETHIEYDCGGPTQQAVASGEIPAGIVGSAGAISTVEAGSVDYVTSLTPEPSPVFPDQPGTEEAGWGTITGGRTQRIYFLPPEVPEERRQTLADGLQEAMEGDTAQTWSGRTGNPINFVGPEKIDEAIEAAFNIEDQIDLSLLEEE